MSNEVQKPERFTEIIPFGTQDKIKLSVQMVQNLIAVKTKSGKTCSEADAIKFIAMCVARRLNPFEGDAFLIGYDGREGPQFSLITAHQAFLKRAELNPEYDGMKSGCIVERDGQVIDLEGDFYLEGDDVKGGWATVYFKNRKQPMHKRIRLQRFQKAFGVWQDDSAGMICKCAEADALRSSFPTMLGGLFLREEMPVETTKITSPLFTEPSTTSQADSKTEPAPDTETKAQKSDLLKSAKAKPTPEVQPMSAKLLELSNLAKRDGITEEQVVSFLKELGTVEGKVKTLADVEKASPDVLDLAIQQWPDISNRLKQTN